MVLLRSECQFINGMVIGRDISYFADSWLVTGTIEFDGSPHGGGWRLFQGQGTKSECVAAGYIRYPVVIFPNDVFKSDYQNACELIALNCALTHAIHLGWRECSLMVTGDSMTVLHWTTSDHFRSIVAFPPIVIFLSLCDTFRVHVVSGVHIPAEENIVCDALSRPDSRMFNKVTRGKCGKNGPLLASQGGLLERVVLACSLNQSSVSEEDIFKLWDASEALSSSIHQRL